jgi:prepilin-type N-terminal cleavage/methylation domain-containing protein/prepilin-type processing-associated H-X9-DG protein
MTKKTTSGRLGNTNRGFTLIECLVVVALMAIMVALLFSSQKKVLEFANKVKCTGHMRNFAVALNAYTSDNSGILPPSAYGGVNNGEVAIYLMPYMGITYTSKNLDMVLNMLECTGKSWRFGFNSYLSQKPVALVERPSEQIYGIDLYSGRWLDSNVLGWKTTDLTQRTPKPHGGKVTVMFLDGHCESRKVSELTRAQVTRNTSSYLSSDETKAIGSTDYDQ